LSIAKNWSPLPRLLSIVLASLIGVVLVLCIGSSAKRNTNARSRQARQIPNPVFGINLLAQNNKQPQSPQAAVITATLTDNVTAATKVAPGGTINYTASITNNGAASPADDATNVNYSAALDGNTTLVAGSVHASPIAFNDTYNWVGNTQLDTTARVLPAVTANDVAVNGNGGSDAFTVAAIAGGATSLGGTVTLAAPSGAFVYTPPLGRPSLADGASVNDTFTYTITNNNNPSLTATGTVTITLTGRVWYLQAGAAGDGRSNTPSGSPAAMSTAADKSADVFYIFANAGSLNGPFTVDAGQQLLGQGVNLVVNAITLFTAAAPTPITTNTAGSCVSLSGSPGNNTVSGFNIGNCTGGTAIIGTNVGTLNVSTLSINTNGAGLSLTGSGNPAVSVVLGGLTSTGGVNNVKLATLGGAITLANGTLSGATGNAIDVNGGVAAITYLGNISNSGGKQVNIANTTGGSVTFDGAIDGSGTGVNLVANSGNTITFRGGVALNTGANAAFNATGGGTVNVCDKNPCGSGAAVVNSLTSTTGAALNVSNTNIGTNNLTFRSVSSNGAASGIILDNTGPNGGLTISGSSSGICGGSVGSGPPTTAAIATSPVTADCTGGTIDNSSSTGILLNSTRNISLTRMWVKNSGGDGIGGTNVNGFTLNSSLIEANGNAIQEANIDFGNLSSITPDGLHGTGAITNSTIRNAFENDVVIRNFGGAALTAFTVTGSQIRSSSASAAGADGLRIEASGTANMTASVTGSFFAANRDDHFQADAINSGTMNVTFKNNTLTGGHSTALGQGITINAATAVPGYSGRIDYDVDGNNINGAILNAITVNLGTSSNAAVFDGFIRNNVIGISGASNLLSCSTQGSGIAVESHGNGTHTSAVTGNILRNCFDRGISVLANDGNGAMNLTVTGNDIKEMSADPSGGREAVNVNNGSADPNIFGLPDSHSMCLNVTSVSGNMVGGPQKNGDIRVRQRFRSSIAMPGYAPPAGNHFNAASVITFLQGNNPGTTATATANDDAGTTFDGFFSSAGCTQPSITSSKKTRERNRPGVVGNTLYMDRLTAAKKRLQPAPANLAPITRKSPRAGNFFMLAKATPKASAAEVARIYHSERTLSHHAVRKTGFWQEPNAPTSGENVTLNTIATFPAAGKSITIKYSATVNTPPLARQVSTQGTVTANAGAISVQTDDPEPAGAANPTVTLVDTLMTWNGVTSTDWNTATNWTQPAGGTQYAPGVSNPAINDVVIPNVGNQPTISATDIGVFSLSLANGRTLTITNPRVLTIGGSPGGDLTLDGIISGANLNLGTGTHVINNAGGTGSLSVTNVATVLSGGTVTLNNNLQAGAVAVNAGGSMIITNRTLSLNGSGAALTVPGGATFTTTGSTVIFNGTAAQTAAGIAYNNLTINNTIGTNVTGVTLTGNATVNGVLALTSSDLATGAFALTQPNTTASTGVSDVIGTVTRTAAFATTTITFGNPNNQITFAAAGTKPTSLTVVLAKNPPATYAAAVQRNYTISAVGAFTSTSTLRLRYLDSEVSGFNAEATLNLRRFRTGDGHWVAQIPGTVDTTNNWVESATVLAADLPTQWTIASLTPTASGGVVTGRIVDDHGLPVEGAVVRLDGAQNRKFITDANGFYRFENVPTNGFYTVTPSRANYSFNPSVRSFTQLGESTDAAFGATLSTGGFVNPLDTPEYFVRQHYIDFLGREPDEAGFNFWSDRILSCDGDQLCIGRKRENVSAAYFLSIEFQKTGGLVAGLYRASYGVAPQYSAFMPDARMVGNGVRVGSDGWEALLQSNTEAFVNSFVNRPAFHQMYDGMADSLFVDTLISHTGVSFTAAERNALVGGLGTGQMTRAEALRSIAENSRFVNAKFNETFVMMEYMGYLRRDPDAGGYGFWLNKLNEFDGNFEQAEMVKAFIVSGEYLQRFSR
jgi:hypothetical protein